MIKITLSLVAAALGSLDLTAQADLNSLRGRSWYNKTAATAAIWRVDNPVGSALAHLLVKDLATETTTHLDVALPFHRVGGVFSVTYTNPNSPGDYKYELIIGGISYTFDTQTIPAWAGVYCRVIVDYSAGSQSFTGSVTETVALPDVDPVGIGYAFTDPQGAADRVVLFDGDKGRLLFAAAAEGALRPRSAFTEELSSFPRNWMQRGVINHLDLGHPDHVLRLGHRADGSRYLKVRWQGGGVWVAQLVDRPSGGPGIPGLPLVYTRYENEMFSPLELPDVDVPGVIGQPASITFHELGGAAIGAPIPVTKGAWVQLPAHSSLYDYVGTQVIMRVDGEVSTQKRMTPVCRYGKAYSSRAGFETSNCFTTPRYEDGKSHRHGVFVLDDQGAAGESITVLASYALWDGTGSPPVVPSGIPGVDLIVANTVLAFANVSIDRIVGSVGLDVSVPSGSGLAGMRVLVQYAFIFTNGDIAVSDVCGGTVQAVATSQALGGGGGASFSTALAERWSGKTGVSVLGKEECEAELAKQRSRLRAKK